jgi:type III pantothenate kinase
MILAVDIGNTLTHAGVFEGYRLVYKIIFPTEKISQDHALPKNIISLSAKHFTNTGISSVVPSVNFYWQVLIKKYFDINPFFISSKVRLPIRLKLNPKSTIGADRICNAVAGFEHFKRKHNVVVIDFGTATTYDFMLNTGEFIGGIISPGIKTAAESMHDKTAKLPLLSERKLVFPQRPIGKNTVEAMQAGIMYAALDSMEGIVKRAEKQYRRKFKVILSGGFAGLINKMTSLDTVVKKYLVMEGINYILKYNNAE